MLVRVSARVRIPTSDSLERTVRVYLKSLQYCIDAAWTQKVTQRVKLQRLVYGKLRSFGLPAQLAIACISQACGMVKKAKSKPLLKRVSVRYNFPRSASLSDDVLSLLTIDGRKKFSYKIPDCYKEYFSWGIPRESLLRIDKKGRAYFIFVFQREVAERTTQGILGIDLGIHHLAVTSKARFYGSALMKQCKRKFSYLRSRLQAKGTRPARRLLKKVAGREQRFMTWNNHSISKNIVEGFAGRRIVMEDLRGIRKQRRGKKMNYWISNWSFSQLQRFIEYKAARKGILVQYVRPQYTSQLCHRCGTRGERNKYEFTCHACHLHKYNADLNASKNLAHPKLDERQAAINQPYSRNDEAKGILTQLRQEFTANTTHFSAW